MLWQSLKSAVRLEGSRHMQYPLWGLCNVSNRSLHKILDLSILALQPHWHVDLYTRALAACLARDPEFLAFFRYPDHRAPDFEFRYRT